MVKYRYLPLHELMKPKDGSTVMMGRYWIVTELDMVVFLKDYDNPQCNKDSGIATMLLRAFENQCGHRDGNKIELINIAYIPWE